MERLTRKDKCKLSHGEEIIICNHDKQDCNDSCMKTKLCKWYEKVQEKLWEYENAEEQGLLLRLPCKVGDTVFDNDFGKTVGYEVTGVSFGDMSEDDCDDKVKVFKESD